MDMTWLTGFARAARVRGIMFDPQCVCFIIILLSRWARAQMRAKRSLHRLLYYVFLCYDHILFGFLILQVAQWYSGTGTDRQYWHIPQVQSYHQCWQSRV